MSLMPIIPDVDASFLKRCWDVSQNVVVKSRRIPSPTNIHHDRSRLTDNYADAYTDTYGTVSGSPFVYKTGVTWPKRTGGPDARPYLREMRPVHGHPIQPLWPGILKNAGVYLEERGVRFTAIMGFAWANAGEKVPFCPLLMTIGVEPKTIDFEVAKTVANYIKSDIIGQAGFSDIEVAVWEWTTSLLGSGPKLPSLNLFVPVPVIEFGHPFASTLGLGVAPLKEPYYEGTVALYLRRGNDSDDVLALTAAHVACPPPMYPDNEGLSHNASSKDREEIVALGTKGFKDGVDRIQTRIGDLTTIIMSTEQRIKWLQQQQANGVVDDAIIATALQSAQQTMDMATSDIQQLNRLFTQVAQSLMFPDKRCIGHVLHADPIGVSSDEPDRFTIDWAVIQLNEDAFDWDSFKGNMVYIGDKIDVIAYLELMYPNIADRAGYEYPEHGLIKIFGHVPASEIHQPLQLNAYGDPAMPVIKNGLTTGTTVGWVNGLKSLVRRFNDNLKFTSLETTIISYGGRGAFSDKGDSGSIILDRKGRIVGLITSGGGLTDDTDVTFATAWYELDPLIKKTLPGVHLY